MFERRCRHRSSRLCPSLDLAATNKSAFPYYSDGWDKHYLNHLIELQLTGLPGFLHSDRGHKNMYSTTFAFRRRQVCHGCGKQCAASSCGGCKCALHCLKECQAACWKIHRKHCRHRGKNKIRWEFKNAN